MFQVLVFRVNVAEEANSNTRSGKSSHSSDDFPEFEAAAADRRCPLAPGALRRLAPVLLGGFSLIYRARKLAALHYIPSSGGCPSLGQAMIMTVLKDIWYFALSTT